MSPFQWRKNRKLSQRAAAEMAGVKGRNPARTWSRWELGERQPPLRVVAKIQTESAGEVSASSWAAVRDKFLARLQPEQQSSIEARP